MKTATLAIAAVSLALGAMAQPSDLHPHAEAAACVSSTLSCNASDTGELAPGDCTLPDGLRYDLWTFAGAAGQRITATLTPLDSSYEKPRLALIPPGLNAPEIRAELGPAPLSFEYNLDSTGTWKLAVETSKLFDAGRYRISLQCDAGYNGAMRDCIWQRLSCGQTYLWSVTPASCKFGNVDWPFSGFIVSLAQGDRVRFSVHATAFDPGVAIYKNGVVALAFNDGKRIKQDAVIDFTATESNNYEIAAYGGTPDSVGELSLTSTCITVCTPPSITTQPVSQTVPLGGSTVLTVAASFSTSVVSFNWYDADNGGLPSALGTGPTFKVTNVKTKHRYYAQAQNGCGVATSAIATITPQTSSRLHSIRH